MGKDRFIQTNILIFFFFYLLIQVKNFPNRSEGKECTCNAGDTGVAGWFPGSGRSPGGGNGNPLLVFLLGRSHRQRSLAGYSPKGCKKSDMTEWLSTRYKWKCLYQLRGTGQKHNTISNILFFQILKHWIETKYSLQFSRLWVYIFSYKEIVRT